MTIHLLGATHLIDQTIADSSLCRHIPPLNQQIAMGWKLREGTHEKSTPEYGDNNEYFSIKMHHSSWFHNIGYSRCYVGGKVNYFDYCEGDVCQHPILIHQFKQCVSTAI
ncbi:hypothetical protein CRG98_009302 [Punica granatum]|uniref:Uncharacterized protein n=1 Tax=Punica granatum TaxID=22663 RepID=A0A2I0KPP4_PUNGR|nr:hypothetical protein CRG98_009302 [Punica granatum]